MAKAAINDLTVHYQQMGKGQDLVMIHGLFSNLAFWYLSVLPALAQNFRVTVYDLRGHGYTDMPARGYTARDMATDLQLLLNYLEIDAAHIVGHSFGGAIGLQLAMCFPKRVQSLILADASVPGLQPAPPLRSAWQWTALRRRLRRVGIEVSDEVPGVAYSLLQELVSLSIRDNPQSSDPWGAALLLRQWNRTPRLAQRWLQLVRTTSAATELGDASNLTVECLGQIQRPTLAIYGEYSTCLSTLWALRGNLPNYIEVIVPDAGHFHPILQPDTFVNNLKQFIQKIHE